MRRYEKRDKAPVDRALVDLHDQRDHLSIQISLLKDADIVDSAALLAMQRNLSLLDNRISMHRASPGD